MSSDLYEVYSPFQKITPLKISIWGDLCSQWASQVALVVKNPPANA